MKILEGSLNAENLTFCIIVSRFNDFITSRLLEGAIDALVRHGADSDSITVIKVP
ncbi:6,7-dimethyl-8-ribityllumazine synthase, partial [Candidatus Magnetoovum chiemensis]